MNVNYYNYNKCTAYIYTSNLIQKLKYIYELDFVMIIKKRVKGYLLIRMSKLKIFKYIFVCIYK